MTFTKFTLDIDEDWTTLLPFALLQVSNAPYMEGLFHARMATVVLLGEGHRD